MGDVARRFRPVAAVALVAVVAVVAAVAVVVGVLALGDGAEDGSAGPRLGFAAGEGPPRVAWQPPPDLAELDAPGWRLDGAGVRSDPGSVTLRYAKGDAIFALSFLSERRYADEGSVGSLVETTRLPVLGVPGRAIDNGDAYSVVAEPRDGWFVSVAATRTSTEEFRALVAALEPVATLDLPASVVGPEEAPGVVADVYAGAELPDGFSPPPVVGWNSQDALVDRLVTDVRCGWAQAYVDGDAAERESVLESLRRSDDWPLTRAVPDGEGAFLGLVELAATEDTPELVRGCPTR